MDAYSEYLVGLANARLGDLRREAAGASLARSVEERAGLRRRRFGVRRRPPRPAIPLPVRADQPAPKELRRSA